MAGLLGCGVMAGLGAAMLTGEVGRGDTVAVFGCGGVGDAAIAGAKLAGARTIVAVDLDAKKLELAKEFGATHTVDASKEDPVAAVQAATEGYGADVCIEAVGNPKVFEQAFNARDLAGTLVQVGVPTPDMRLDLQFIELFGRGGRIKPSWYGDCLPSRDFPMLVDLHLQGRLPLERFVSRDDLARGRRGGVPQDGARRGPPVRRRAVALVEKVIWLLRGPGSASVDVVDALRDVALEPSVLGLTVNQHDDAALEAPSPAPAPDGETTHVVEVSAWFDNYQGRGVVDEAVELLGLTTDSYLVVESLVDDYGTTPHAGARTWPDGERSPGLLTVAVIHRPESLGEAAWIHNWHEVQSPVSGQLQPRTRYVRNQVVRALSPEAPDIGGIVEEGWPSARHVADPMLFFDAGGDPAVMNANIETMMGNVIACLDLDRLRSTTMSEYLLKSLGGGG